MKRFLPETIWRKLRSEVNVDVRRERAADVARLPRVVLDRTHLGNLTVVPTREDLLDRLQKNAVVAELGVDHGVFSRAIIKHTSPRKLHLIDAWADERFHAGLDAVRQAFAEDLRGGTIEIHRGLSIDVLGTFAPAYFDWVYIDTDHSYETTRAELAVARSRVRPGGMIAGHDFTMGNWVTGIRYGVVEAVREFCVEHHWQIVYLTSQSDGHDSFALSELVL